MKDLLNDLLSKFKKKSDCFCAGIFTFSSSGISFGLERYSSLTNGSKFITVSVYHGNNIEVYRTL